jgi:hypothetical protein
MMGCVYDVADAVVLVVVGPDDTIGAGSGAGGGGGGGFGFIVGPLIN